MRGKGKTWITAFAGMTMVVSVAAPASAEWVKVGTTNMAVHYVDTASVRTDGNLRRVWAMQDLVGDRADGVRSIRALQEHNCADGRFRYLALAVHSGQMGGGELLTEHAMREAWSRPGVTRSAIGKIVCER